jgi:hypothetical protein
MKTLITSIMCLLLASFTVAAADLNKVVDKAFAGERVDGVNVDGHNFHVLPITIVRGKKGIAASGLISHDIRLRPDDQISYKIVIKEGEETKYEIRIARGGVEQFLPIPNKMKGKTGKLIDGDWEPSCQRIIDVIAAKLELE